MSVETGPGIQSHHDIERLKTILKNFTHVNTVTYELIPGGKTIEYTIIVDTQTPDHSDITINTIKNTLIPNIAMLSNEDGWYPQGEGPVNPILLRVGGLNPDITTNPGIHTQ